MANTQYQPAEYETRLGYAPNQKTLEFVDEPTLSTEPRKKMSKLKKMLLTSSLIGAGIASALGGYIGYKATHMDFTGVHVMEGFSDSIGLKDSQKNPNYKISPVQKQEPIEKPAQLKQKEEQKDAMADAIAAPMAKYLIDIGKEITSSKK